MNRAKFSAINLCIYLKINVFSDYFACINRAASDYNKKLKIVHAPFGVMCDHLR